MSGYRMFLPVKPDGTIMEMFPLRDPESALVAAAHFMPRSTSGEELRKSEELAPSCWRAFGGGWGFSDALAVEMAKAFGYTTVEVFLHPAQGRKVELPKVREALECAESRLRCLLSDVFTSNFTDRYDDGDACRKTLSVVQQGLAEIDAAEGRK